MTPRRAIREEPATWMSFTSKTLLARAAVDVIVGATVMRCGEKGGLLYQRDHFLSEMRSPHSVHQKRSGWQARRSRNAGHVLPNASACHALRPREALGSMSAIRTKLEGEGVAEV